MEHKINLDHINKTMKNKTPRERILLAYQIFGDKLYALTSAGVDSALMIDYLFKTKKEIDIIHINSGFLPIETINFKKQLEKLYNKQFIEYSPSEEIINDINEMDLWIEDSELYSKLTKINPLKHAIKDLKINALLSGVRSDQTNNRLTLNFIDKSSDGVYRINPFLDWSHRDVNEYIENNELPRNKLFYEGFESVGDLHLTIPGSKRQGRRIMECGINVLSGNPIVTERKL